MHGFDPLVEAELLKEGRSGAFSVGNLEFRIGDDAGTAMTRAALPKGTTRKYALASSKDCQV